MLRYDTSTLIILPHLDDEFALFPVLKNFLRTNNSDKIDIIYCAERKSSRNKKLKRRRKDNMKALAIFGIYQSNIIYLNDYFNVEDNYLYKSIKSIYEFLENFININSYSQIITLDFEGGHPDHDCLALIVNKISGKNNIKKFFFPAYNSRNLFLIPYSVLRPLKKREKDAERINGGAFCWIGILRLPFIYSTEKKAFFFLMPMLIFKAFFSHKIIYFNFINPNSFKWENSLSFRRYGVKLSDISKQFNKLNND